MNWTDAYFRYKMLAEIVGGAVAIVGVVLFFGFVLYDALHEGRKKK